MVLSCFTQETEARRKVLRGRGTVTRDYYRGLAIPAWAIIVICSLGYIIIGGIVYLVMRKFVLSSDDEEYPAQTYPTQNYPTTYSPVQTSEVA